MPISSSTKESLNGISIDHRLLREQIADRLQEAILAGDLAPGEAIIETDVASRFRVSRAPVREALQLLSNRGLVDIEPYRGTTVRRLDRRDLEEVFAMRQMLEVFAIRLVVRTRSRETLRLLARLCEEMEHFAEAGDWRKVNEIDDRLHASLIQAAGYRMLERYWQDINVLVRRAISLRNERHEDIIQIARNHRAIIEAIHARDESRAAQLLSEHLTAAAELMLENELFEA